MKPEDLKKLLEQPESEELEFKSHLPYTGHLAALISAFANTHGGRLVVGVRDDRSIVGLDHVGRDACELDRHSKPFHRPYRLKLTLLALMANRYWLSQFRREFSLPILLVGRHFSDLVTE